MPHSLATWAESSILKIPSGERSKTEFIANQIKIQSPKSDPLTSAGYQVLYCLCMELAHFNGVLSQQE